MFEQNLQLPASGFGDLLMAGVALAMGFWTYRFGPSNSRTMLRLWVMAFLFLFLGGVLGAILEFTSNTMSDRDKLTGQLFLAAMYMLAGMFQLFGVHEAVDIGKWNKDLIFGVTGTAFVVLLVSAIVYEHPGLKMYFLLYSSGMALVILLINIGKSIKKYQWFVLGAFLQTLGILVYFMEASILTISYSLILNLLMLFGMLAYYMGLFILARYERATIENSSFFFSGRVSR